VDDNNDSVVIPSDADFTRGGEIALNFSKLSVALSNLKDPTIFGDDYKKLFDRLKDAGKVENGKVYATWSLNQKAQIEKDLKTGIETAQGLVKWQDVAVENYEKNRRKLRDSISIARREAEVAAQDAIQQKLHQMRESYRASADLSKEGFIKYKKEVDAVLAQLDTGPKAAAQKVEAALQKVLASLPSADTPEGKQFAVRLAAVTEDPSKFALGLAASFADLGFRQSKNLTAFHDAMGQFAPYKGPKPYFVAAAYEAFSDRVDRTLEDPTTLVTDPIHAADALLTNPGEVFDTMVTQMVNNPGGFAGSALFDYATGKIALAALKPLVAVGKGQALNPEKVAPRTGAGHHGVELESLASGGPVKPHSEIVFEHKPTSGAILKTSPDKTTTVLGSFPADMENVIKELNYPVQRGALADVTFEGNPGGYNLLNVSKKMYYEAGELKGGFFGNVNAKWLDAAVARGDNIVVVSDLKYMRDASGELTGFGKEIKYLQDKYGYTYDAATHSMIPPKR